MKKYQVIFSPLALNDIEQVVGYYNEQQHGLGKRFAAQVQVTLTAIKKNPFFASVRYDDVRCAQVKKFPFLVHYIIDEDSSIVTIAAVYSTYQEPFW
jgi:plasmid stabilization system protein ParE